MRAPVSPRPSAAGPAQALPAGGRHFGHGWRGSVGRAGPSRVTGMPRRRARAAASGFPRLEGSAGKHVLSVRDGNSGLAWDQRPARPEPRVAGPWSRRVPAASRRPGPLLGDGFVLAGGGGAEGGSGREPEVGPAAFLGIKWRHSLPPLGRVPGWELAEFHSWKCVWATFLLFLVTLLWCCGHPKETFPRVFPPGQGPASGGRRGLS